MTDKIKVKFFMDTEFNERGRFHPIELLSIGIVCENGKSLYLENIEADRKLCNNWVKENVLRNMNTSLEVQEKLLDGVPFDTNFEVMKGMEDLDNYNSRCYHNLFTISEIASQILTFITENAFNKNAKPEFWGYFCDYDWVLFCQLYGTMIQLPKGFPFYCNDLKQLMKFYEVDKSLDELVNSKSNHNALSDARQIKKGYDLLTATISHNINKKQFIKS